MKYRSRTDITAQILEAATGGTSKTKIMYKAFVSYAQLKEYMEVLITNDLLTIEAGGDVFRTTAKGSRFLQIYNNIDQFTTVRPDAGRRVAY
jgi:predicted transcriptional regulator